MLSIFGYCGELCVGDLTPLGLIPTLRSDMVSNPLGGGRGSALRGPFREVGEASLPPNLVLDIKESAPSCLLGQLVRLLVAGDPRVGWNSVDGHLIAAGH